MDDKITIQIQRFDPEKDSPGHVEMFHIPKEASEGMTVISALKYIRENIDESLAFYYSCELAKCRGCLMEVNSEAAFACTKPVEDGQTIGPLRHLPVIRDLVVKFILSEIHLDEAACVGCEDCIAACPMDIYEMSETGDKAMVRSGRIMGGSGHEVDCIGCRRCEKICPVDVIEIRHLKPLYQKAPRGEK